MIQRIQSLYLLLAIAALACMFFFPMAFFYGEQANLAFYACHIDFFDPNPTIELHKYFILPFLSVAMFIIILLITSLFSYKNRKRQLSLNRISIFLNLALIAGFFFGYVYYLEKATAAVADYQLASIFPLIVFIFILLANRGISKDEKLIRSMNRLR